MMMIKVNLKVLNTPWKYIVEIFQNAVSRDSIRRLVLEIAGGGQIRPLPPGSRGYGYSPGGAGLTTRQSNSAPKIVVYTNFQ